MGVHRLGHIGDHPMALDPLGPLDAPCENCKVLREALVALTAEAAAVAGRQVLADPADTRLRDAVRAARTAIEQQ